MTRDETIRIIAANLPESNPANMSTVAFERITHYNAERIFRALLAAGVIPAEGMVVVDAQRWELITTLISATTAWRDAAAVNYPKAITGDIREMIAETAMLRAHNALRRFDVEAEERLDAIPDAPNGEHAGIP